MPVDLARLANVAERVRTYEHAARTRALAAQGRCADGRLIHSTTDPAVEAEEEGGVEDAS